MTKKKSCVVHVAHRVSHRTRFKVDKRHRTPQNLGRIKEALERAHGVDQVHVNEKTGSVTVQHGTGAEVSGRCHEILSELMCECVEVAVEAVEPELGPFAAIFTKLLPMASHSAKNGTGEKSMITPVSLIALGFFGGLHFRALIVKLPLAEFLPFV